MVGNLRDTFVALLQRRSIKETFKDLRLERLNEFQLASLLEFESLELSQRSVKVEYGTSLLQQLSLFEARRQNHVS
jgi:hypothetical protein